MKFLLFTLEYPPFFGGVANYYANLVKYWPSGSINVLDNNQGKLVSHNLPFLKWLPSLIELWRVVKRERNTYILVGQILPLGIASYLVSKINKIKYSVVLHGMDLNFALKTLRKRWITKKILKKSDKIICANNYTALLVKDLIGEGEEKKIFVVNPGVEIETDYNDAEVENNLRDKYNLKNKIVLLGVGRLVKRKGFDKVIESLPSVLKKVQDLVYVIVGSGEELIRLRRTIFNFSAKGGSAFGGQLQDKVIIITDASDEEKNSWYKISDIFIMPSRNIDGDFEGFGTVFLEANLAGRPVIAGDSGGVRDAVENGVNGLLVNPLSVSAIAAAIIKLALDKNLREKLGEQGRVRAIREFSWKGQVRKFHDIIND